MSIGWRRLRMGLNTLSGRRREGFFIPYRHAATVPRPPDPAAQGYPAIARLFAAHEADFAATLDLVDAHADALRRLDGPAPEPRWGQSWFPRLDGAAAYALVASGGPARIVEVGSGHSTRFLARAARDAGHATAIACIDPEPRAALPPGVAHLPEVLGARHAPLFAALRAGDMAVFDSSHILHPHTDVDLILNHILPELAPGVLVHFHDIFLPDPYPAEWTWRGYGEQNGLGGWLLGGGLRPALSSRYAITRMGAAARPGLRGLALAEGAVEASLWCRKA